MFFSFGMFFTKFNLGLIVITLTILSRRYIALQQIPTSTPHPPTSPPKPEPTATPTLIPLVALIMVQVEKIGVLIGNVD